jgi:hypothetical protein
MERRRANIMKPTEEQPVRMSVVQEGLIDDVVKLQYDEYLLKTVTKEEAEGFGEAFYKGMCKNAKWLAIAKLVAIDCKERKTEETK